MLITDFEFLPETRVAVAAIIPGAVHPGDEWQYGDSTDYVAVLVEKMSGQSLDQFLRERIFEPLGMTGGYYHAMTAATPWTGAAARNSRSPRRNPCAFRVHVPY